VGTEEQLERVFGSQGQTVYAARQQIREGGVPQIVRTMPTEPWNPATLLIGLEDPQGSLNGNLYQHPSTPAFVVAAVVVVDRNDVSDAAVFGAYESLVIELLNDSGAVVEDVEASLDPGDANYLGQLDVEGVQLYASFINVQTALRGENIGSRYVPDGALDFTGQSPSRGQTPWITSQSDVRGGEQRLFRFRGLSEGDNQDVKVSIANIRRNSFDVQVRDFTDSDLNPEVLEEFEGVNLDSESEDFIARRIGTDVPVFGGGQLQNSGGQYELRSRYVQVEMASLTFPDRAVPFGFEGYSEPVVAPQDVAVPNLPVTRNRQGVEAEVLGARRRNLYLGIDLADTGAQPFAARTPNNADTQPGYTLESVLGPDVFDSDLDDRKFTVAFQDGYEGSNPYVKPKYGDNVQPQNVQGLDCSSFDASGTEAYQTAFQVLSDSEAVEASHVSTPAVIAEDHAPVISQAQSLCEARGDCLYTYQASHFGKSVSDIAKDAEAAYGSFVAAYQGWLQSPNTSFDLPLADLIPAVFAQNDNQASPAKAPAGSVRGRIRGSRIKEVFGRREREQLLGQNINHASKTRERLQVIGNETRRPGGALANLNVRRGVNFAKLVAQSAAREILFEPNTRDTREFLKDEVVSRLEPVARRGGIRQFVVETSGERNAIRGAIAIQFEQVVDTIQIDFEVQRDQVVFT
jgi:hypothetical protein